ncbi:CinA family protein [Stutzerimonas tarimensis]|uniref:CinA family protein n=1 Tax=Stutzerimonas tarimensis TaxID=1507735 RepID=A0ABV7T2N3_9GAMM
MQGLDQLIALLKARELSLVTAESCTCGLMASLLGDIPGCGAVLYGGFVVYDEEAKYRLIGVNRETVERFGLTSEEVAREMAIGALRVTGARLAVSNTGVADDSAEDASGTQCYAYALAGNDGTRVVSETVQFEGDRVAIRKQAARYGLEQLMARYAELTVQRPLG